MTTNGVLEDVVLVVHEIIIFTFIILCAFNFDHLIIINYIHTAIDHRHRHQCHITPYHHACTQNHRN